MNYPSPCPLPQGERERGKGFLRGGERDEENIFNLYRDDDMFDAYGNR
jgi:hypothetical protein